MNEKKRGAGADGSPGRHSAAELTVIVPVYNRRDIVTRTLDSIATQTLLPRKLVLVDNNSTDGSVDVLRRWAREHENIATEIIVCQETAPGAAAARNRGLREADTAFTFFFDSDDTMRPHLVARLFDEIERHPGSDLFFWKADFHRDNHIRELKYRTSDILVNHIHHGLFSTQRFAARTALLKNIGGWDEAMRVWDDWELGVRLLLNATSVRPIPETLVDVYFLSESITGDDFSSRAEGIVKAVGAALRSLESAGAEMRTRAHAAMTYAILAGNCAKEGNPAAGAAALRKAVDYPGLGARRRLAMRCAYHWTARGFRGAAEIFGRML